jgi:osmotically inducible lipoprotein OsmB
VHTFILTAHHQGDFSMKFINKSSALVLSFAALMSLVACGDRPGERALSGAGIGAGSGAVLGAVTGMGPGTGAVIGGAVGAAAGGLTDKSDINLGKPIWE